MTAPPTPQDERTVTTGPPPGSPQKKKPSRVAKKTTVQKAGLQRDALVRVRGLRTAAKEVTRSYLSNLEHEILELIDLIDSQGGKKKMPKAQTLERVIEVLDHVSLKPEKGRRKDLKRIEMAVSQILSILSKKKG